MNRTLVAANAGTKPDMPRGFQRCGLSPIAWGEHQPSFAGRYACCCSTPQVPALRVLCSRGEYGAVSTLFHPPVLFTSTACGLGTGDWGLWIRRQPARQQRRRIRHSLVARMTVPNSSWRNLGCENEPAKGSTTGGRMRDAH